MEKRIKITVKGFVQGVGFRYFAYKKANEYGLTGYVKNLINGDVEAEAQGNSGIVNDFLSDLKIGPSGSYVKSVITEDIPLQLNEAEFEIK
ncbi:MAG: acylphosphatase [Ignavibacteria bacterium]|nr:acylphosphatase [Ignavibacteria bacterium]